jgi:hypothetical protein
MHPESVAPCLFTCIASSDCTLEIHTRRELQVSAGMLGAITPLQGTDHDTPSNVLKELLIMQVCWQPIAAEIEILAFGTLLM